MQRYSIEVTGEELKALISFSKKILNAAEITKTSTRLGIQVKILSILKKNKSALNAFQIKELLKEQRYDFTTPIRLTHNNARD